jgi:hypothetical protein
VRPCEGERLALPKPDRQGEDPPGCVPTSPSRVEQPPGLVTGEGPDLLHLRCRRVDERAHVAGDQASLHRHDEGTRQAAVHFEHARAVEAGASEPDEQGLDVLRRELPQPDPPEGGHQVAPDHHLLRAEGRFADPRRLDGVCQYQSHWSTVGPAPLPSLRAALEREVTGTVGPVVQDDLVNVASHRRAGTEVPRNSGHPLQSHIHQVHRRAVERVTLTSRIHSQGHPNDLRPLEHLLRRRRTAISVRS